MNFILRMKKKNQVTINADSLEDFIWMSYRYCIGRKTIAAAMHADTIKNIIHKNPDCMSEERKAFMAKDIRSSINDILHWRDDVDIENFGKYDVYTQLLLEVSNHDNANKLKFTIDTATRKVYVDEMDKEHELDYDYYDLVRWTKLANYLDKDCHRIVVTEYEGKIEERVCYPYPISQIDENHCRLQGKFELAWTPLDSQVGQDRYIAQEFIKKIKKL